MLSQQQPSQRKQGSGGMRAANPHRTPHDHALPAPQGLSSATTGGIGGSKAPEELPMLVELRLLLFPLLLLFPPCISALIVGVNSNQGIIQFS